MGDLFGDWINYTDKNGTVTPKNIVYPVVGRCPQHTFLFKTKCPWNLLKWSPFPLNCYVGATCTSKRMVNHTLPYLMKVGARLIYLSLEPLLEWDDYSAKITGDRLLDAGVGWVIIGAQTKPYKPPKMKWIDDIVFACGKAGIPVFLKDNLQPLVEEVFKGAANYSSPILTPDNKLRQEFPK